MQLVHVLSVVRQLLVLSFIATRYPFSPSVFQCYLMGIRNALLSLAHDWEPYLQRGISDVLHDLPVNSALQSNPYLKTKTDCLLNHNNYDRSSFQLDEFDPQTADDDTRQMKSVLFDIEATGLLRCQNSKTSLHCYARSIRLPR